MTLYMYTCTTYVRTLAYGAKQVKAEHLPCTGNLRSTAQILMLSMEKTMAWLPIREFRFAS